MAMACTSTPEPTPTLEPTATPEPTATLEPTPTPAMLQIDLTLDQFGASLALV